MNNTHEINLNLKCYHFYVIVNNDIIFKRNTENAIQKLISKRQNVFFHVTVNFQNQYSSIREWINSILRETYASREEFKGSRLMFIHQDVFFSDTFIDDVEAFLSSDQKSIGLFGFAGIDNYGNHHKFMVDSDNFSFTGDVSPVVVDSVDEFLFGIEFDVFYNYRILLADVKGWHAYAAEFSIILKGYDYLTVMLPVFTYHNSIRINNYGVTATHKELFHIYGIPIKTLVGFIEHKTFFQIIKNYVYSFYVNYFKFKYRNNCFDTLKSYILDDLRLHYNENRVKQNLIKQFDIVYYLHLSDNIAYERFYEINLGGTKIYFYLIRKIDDALLKGDVNVLISGISYQLEGFSFDYKTKLNIRRRRKL